jgi:6-pyruvoyltetrahydropterin 2'-reductase
VLTDEFLVNVDLFNCSMKLSNSGHTYDERVDEETQSQMVNMAQKEYAPDVKWKFVVSSEEDMDEIIDLIDTLDIPDEYVSLMPAGQTQEQLRETYPKVAEIVKTMGWDFTPRLHVDTWNLQTGV